MNDFIKICFFSLLLLYDVELRRGDLKCETLINLITSFVVVDEVYIVLFNLYCKAYKDSVSAFSDILSASESMSLKDLDLPRAL